jgi:hypothetical protein
LLLKTTLAHGVPRPGLTPKEDDMQKFGLTAGRCEECEGRQFRFGPRGGISRNVECVGCKARYNVAIIDGYVVMADPISRDADWDALGYNTTGRLMEAE